MNIMQKMKACESLYSGAEQKVYQTIISNPKFVIQYTMTAIATSADTSISAVQRFCQTLGYRGFKDFQSDMAHYLQEEERMNSEDSEDPLICVPQMFGSAILALQELPKPLLEDMVEDMLTAKCVYCFGLHRSFLPAEKLRLNLEDSGVMAMSANNAVACDHSSNAMNGESVAILFSVSGSTVHYERVIYALSAKNVKIWLVTTSPQPKMKRWISNVISLPTVNYDKRFTLDDHVIMIAFVELISCILQQKKSELSDSQ